MTSREDTVEKLLYDPREAARLLSISRTKVYELMAAGKLPSLRIGHSRRIPAEALHRFIETYEEVTL
jgi:excisionase family DNA binding protein